MLIVDLSRAAPFHQSESLVARKRAAITVPIMALLLLFSGLYAPSAQAQTCPFDDGNSSLEVEGLILTRYALGRTGAPLVASTNINAVDAPTVEATINCPSCALNITGNPTMTVADATIISRKLAGFSGAALTDSLALGTGTRNTSAAVQSFLLAGCGATGGTVTSITAGAGLTGGTITASGTIAADTTFLQRRVATPCAAGNFITAIAADGTPTCATPPSGAGGTVTNVATGTGLTGGPITAAGTIAVDSAVVQLRVSSTCAAGTFITAVAANGTVSCAAAPAGNSGTVTSVATGSGILGGPITATGTLSADTSFLQRRLSSTCGAGSFITAVAADGTVTCTAAPAGNSGTVTNVATGPGLTGGPITATGTIALATTQLLPTVACATSQIAQWNGTAWVCAAPPPTLPASCLDGQLLKLQAGAIVCSAAPQTFVNVDGGGALGNVGQHPSVAIPFYDGRPVISYFDLTNSSLKLTKCGNASCSAANVAITLDNAGAVGRHTSVAVGTPGADFSPVISYFTGSGTAANAPGTLKVAKCVDVNCTGAPTLTVIDNSVASVGLYTSIAIPPAGAPDRFPVISYYDGTNGNLKVAKCINAACSGAAIINTLDGVAPAIDIGRFTSIAVPADGLPVISYQDVTNNKLKVAKCSAADCSGVPTLTTPATAGQGLHTSIALSADGFPVISHQNSLGGTLVVFKCTNATCSTGSGANIDSGLLATFTSIAVPADGKPVISYHDGTSITLKIVKCGNATCSAGNTVNTVDSPTVGQGTAIAVPADGLPFVAYYDSANTRLKTVKCSNAGCANP